MAEFFTSVHLDESKCKGCINCIKRCPTEAIRVRNGKAVITTKACIDCGECIRQCKNHAKLPTHDSMDEIKNYKYTVALPAPSLYAQVNNLDDIDIVLTALKDMGFDDVFEVSHAAEIVSALSRKYIPAHKEDWPIISTACPSVTRLIRVRFPNLIDHLLPIKPPMEIAAEMARKRAIEKTGLPSEDIGIFFLSPCPAKVTSVKSPLGYRKSDVDHVLSIKDIYPRLIASMKAVVEEDRVEELSETGNIGISWGSSGGEAGGLLTDSYLAADGIENVLKVLEDLEDQKFANTLSFIELNACHGGCVGGVLAVENPFLAKVKLKSLRKYIPIARTHDVPPDIHPEWTEPVIYEPVFTLGDSMIQSLLLMKKVDELTESFPGLDCGSCGAPSCRALAEDIVRGKASEKDCIHIFKQYIHKLSDEFSHLQ
ncbi:MAG: 4Fe-4S dicluster domain-containing protein [Lachnospiraceae bacterium]|nr:4Fe-4S dicluster domain-containing protein [Lachnospiraceae bacterium]